MANYDLLGVDVTQGVSRRLKITDTLTLPLSALSDVQTSSPSSDDILQWSSVNSRWQNEVLRVSGSRTVINVPGHSFEVLDGLGISGGTWSTVTAPNGIAVVLEVLDANNVVVGFGGLHTVTAHGLTVGTTYFLSDTTAGLVTSTAPTSINQPLLVPVDTNTVFINIYRAAEVSDLNYISVEIDYDALIDGEQVIFSVPENKQFLFERLIVYVSTLDNLTSAGNLNLFYDSPSKFIIENLSLGAQQSSITSATFWSFPVGVSGERVPELTDLVFDIDGVTATDFTVKAQLVGRLVST